MNFMSQLDDKELLYRLQKGEEAAFTEIYNRYWKQLFAVAAHKINDLSEAEEVVQDIFLDIWKRRAQLSVTSCLSAYLSVCVKYKVINRLARKHRAAAYTAYASRSLDAADHTTENWLQFAELEKLLWKETGRLPQKCRLVFQLSREKGLSQKQIALELRISEKTVESHLAKALRILRTSLGQFLTHLFF